MIAFIILLSGAYFFLNLHIQARIMKARGLQKNQKHALVTLLWIVPFLGALIVKIILNRTGNKNHWIKGHFIEIEKGYVGSFID